MKKTKIFISLLVLVALFATFTLAACDGTADTFQKLIGIEQSNANPEPISPYLPLFDENGIYLEENFAYNMALEKENGITLIANGTTDYVIVTIEEPSQDIVWAAEDLALAFEGICGTKPEIVTDSTIAVAHEIVLGETNRAYKSSLKPQDFGAYYIDTNEESLYICGPTDEGTANGVYGFMEDTLGCVFISKNTTYYPSLKTAIVEPISNVWEPTFTYRDVGSLEVWRDEHFCNKLRSSTTAFSSDGCHKSLGYISSDILAEHPEYYAEINGVRQTGDYMFQGPQLCFSNPDVIDLLEEALIARASSYDGDQEIWWDMSQQDSMNYCTCETCNALSEQYQSRIAPILICINTIAKRHPEYKFSTLSYHYGSTPPVGIEIADNLMIKWCIMSSYGRNDYIKPISECNSAIAKQQYEEITGWKDLTENIFVWDYITDYFSYLLPFPCLGAMQGNIQLLSESNVVGVLTLSSHNNRGYADYLKANYAAHLLWNPNINSTELINKFLTVYFGKDVAPYIIKMYHAMEDSVKGMLCVYDFPVSHASDLYSLDSYNLFSGYLNSAFEAAGDDEVILSRLRYEKLSLLYIQIALKYGTKDELAAAKTEFKEICAEFDITALNELYTLSVEDFAK